ncbi:hypothetical protein GLOIN_2v1571485 [Rhizophagus irregularis DAOM 181602=DAOM 197198]|uniref:Uncharacterized protein n=1 Tax=Rhizophagus irregularis (strain DAOM 181602 / DAOM 197198 / MUCL 43194) TaxID=747089 RepID=A0A2P4QBF0_RHIID|nr:hypothetical protein GLOIN_2v1571485 [Rhizophagus irregularis DAOM 181602=DAOM 197198]POG74959.1 hypothetical protein GLOIN_2v1571485 [Rhizophagus irregularis DAOM 181602=DAOM 197198]|eukprot:XP_025181825.1 hypothetical protein GLOIN_2v1571485 [Rhizophagus irregularis DAOM 181602=DAOM 197198]
MKKLLILLIIAIDKSPLFVVWNFISIQRILDDALIELILYFHVNLLINYYLILIFL